MYLEGKNISTIEKDLTLSRPIIHKCIDEALAAGVETALKNKYRSPRDPVITEEPKA
jgi:hypothetical protein